MKKAKDFRDMSIEELDATHQELCKELFIAKNKIRQEKKSEKPHLVSHAKKEIARLLTVLREKQLAQ